MFDAKTSMFDSVPVYIPQTAPSSIFDEPEPIPVYRKQEPAKEAEAEVYYKPAPEPDKVYSKPAPTDQHEPGEVYFKPLDDTQIDPEAQVPEDFETSQDTDSEAEVPEDFETPQEIDSEAQLETEAQVQNGDLDILEDTEIEAQVPVHSTQVLETSEPVLDVRSNDETDPEEVYYKPAPADQSEPGEVYFKPLPDTDIDIEAQDLETLPAETSQALIRPFSDPQDDTCECRNYYVLTCDVKEIKECDTEFEEVCSTKFRDECKDEVKQLCEPVLEEKCTTEKEEKCETVVSKKVTFEKKKKCETVGHKEMIFIDGQKEECETVFKTEKTVEKEEQCHIAGIAYRILGFSDMYTANIFVIKSTTLTL